MNLDEVSADSGQEISATVADTVRQSLLIFRKPRLLRLDETIDKRLVRTLYKTVEAIITFRHSSLGLLLSELGGYILSPDKAKAGTKRISNLLRSPKWSHNPIQHFLWEQASEQLTALDAKDSTALVIWDESVIEKHESQKLEGLCPVRSSKAKSRLRIKPGYYNPPGFGSVDGVDSI